MRSEQTVFEHPYNISQIALAKKQQQNYIDLVLTHETSSLRLVETQSSVTTIPKRRLGSEKRSLPEKNKTKRKMNKIYV